MCNLVTMLDWRNVWNQGLFRVPGCAEYKSRLSEGPLVHVTTVHFPEVQLNVNISQPECLFLKTKTSNMSKVVTVPPIHCWDCKSSNISLFTRRVIREIYQSWGFLQLKLDFLSSTPLFSTQDKVPLTETNQM